MFKNRKKKHDNLYESVVEAGSTISLQLTVFFLKKDKNSLVNQIPIPLINFNYNYN